MAADLKESRRVLTNGALSVRAAVEDLARRAAEAGIASDEIRHSGPVRARKTAEILARTLAPRGGVAPSKGLRPDDDPEGFAIEAGVLAVPTSS